MHNRPMTTTEQTGTFTTTAYGHTLTGTFTTLGWAPSDETKQILDGMDPRKARRAALRCMHAADKAHARACETINA